MNISGLYALWDDLHPNNLPRRHPNLIALLGKAA